MHQGGGGLLSTLAPPPLQPSSSVLACMLSGWRQCAQHHSLQPLPTPGGAAWPLPHRLRPHLRKSLAYFAKHHGDASVPHDLLEQLLVAELQPLVRAVAAAAWLP